MGNKVKIGDRWVGDGEPCFVVAEIGINHNGDLEIAYGKPINPFNRNEYSGLDRPRY